MLTDEQRDAILVEVHRAIEEAATDAGNAPGAARVQLAYPPNHGFTPDEEVALRGLKLSLIERSALRKVVADACSRPLSRLFGLLDGIGDPTYWQGQWGPFELVRSEDGEVLSELWHEGYWRWRQLRPDPGWSLDTYEG